MSGFSHGMRMEAPAGPICEFLLDLSRRPRITGMFQDRFHLLRLDPVGIGAAASFRLGRPLQWWMETEITDVSAERWIREDGRAARFWRVATRTEWEITPESDTVTSVRVSFEVDAPLVDRPRLMLGGLAWLGHQHWRALTRLRRISETADWDSPVARATVGGLSPSSDPLAPGLRAHAHEPLQPDS